MNNFYTNKIFLIVLALIICVLGLVAQNLPSTSSPTVSDKIIDYITLSENEIPPGSELIIQLEKNDTNNPPGKTGWPVLLNISEADKQNSLIKTVINFHGNSLHGEGSYIGEYSISPDGQQIMYNLGFYNRRARFENEPEQWRSYYELYYFKAGMRNPKLVGQTGSFDKNIMFPFSVKYWINNYKILLEAVNDGVPNPLGIVIYDVSKFESSRILINQRYLNTPVSYENGTKLFYFVLDGNQPVNIESLRGKSLMYSYDLIEKQEVQIPDIPKELQNKEIQSRSDNKDFAPNEQNLFFMPPNANGCLLSGSPPLFFPWICNKAMCVERDGPQPCAGSNCDMSKHDMSVEYSDCSLNPGSSYNGACNSCPTQTCGHTRPAIDFSDGALWLQTGTPVLASADGEAQKRYEPVGAGNYVIIRHQRIGFPIGTFVYTYYMHLSTVASNIPTNSWISIKRGNQIGLEGKTGGDYSPHYHFELKDADALSHSFYPIFSEYGGATPKTGRTYISKNIPTDGSMKIGYDCSSITSVSCNGVLTGQTTNGSASRYATYGNGYHNWPEFGPEKLYQLTTTKSGTITVTLSSVSFIVGADLDVFILASPGSCANLDPLINIRGTSSGNTATYSNAPAGTYYIIVEGYKGTIGNYTLNVNAPCNGLPNLTDNNASKTTGGRNITITARVKNNGGLNAGVFQTGFYLQNVTTGYYYGLASLKYSGGLPSGGTSTFTFTPITPSNVPAGYYKLVEFIDNLYNVTESDENDNAWYIEINFISLQGLRKI
ncbi:MAG: peptidoglycan DD-metalloendopeptidase family protein [Saprospiraceae bacterium]|nr:peptidoglycan DD-metalloendopeptidase family protein [Candidatus Vicinibacter affinis]